MPFEAPRQASSFTLAEKRAFLEGAAWPDEPLPEVIETHAALVFLSRDRAWKMKKPVLLPHVDLRSREQREYFCREELRLNRQLAGSVYRGLVPLIERPDGGLALGGTGTVVDWLVEMDRLPAAQMLDCRLRSGPEPRPEEIEAAADLLIGFYGTRDPQPDAGERYFTRLLREARTNAEHLRELRHELGPKAHDHIFDFGQKAIEACRDEILARGARGVVVEGHGDLRAEHVCLTDPPVIFDRVEIDRDYRLVDPYYEFNALGHDCATMGAPWIAAVLLVRLAHSGIPAPSSALLKAYSVGHHLTRARLAINHLRDAEIREPHKWPAVARLHLAAVAGMPEVERPG